MILIDDATAGVGLIVEIAHDIETVNGDAAYDTRPFYAAARS